VTALALDRAPAAARPLHYLQLVPVWGVLAAGLLLAQGPSVFASRWGPGTIALVHAFTLGVLGNAMLGALLQFLPVVAGVRPRGLDRFGRGLPVAFNIAASGLVVGLAYWPPLVPWAAVALAGALVWFACAGLAGMRFDGRQTVLRLGLAGVLIALALVAILGAVLALLMAGAASADPLLVTDVHAAIGIFGTVLLLAGTVGSVVLPMFQGTASVPQGVLGGWLVVHVLGLVLAAIARCAGDADLTGKLLAGLASLFALAVLGLQWTAPHRRNPALVGFWRWGAFALLAAAVLASLGSFVPRRAVLVGVLVLGIGLPALVLGMWLEITAFLSWLELQRRRVRGHRVPSTDALMPESTKARLLCLHVASGAALVAAAAVPHAATVAGAALALAAAYGGTGRVLLQLRRRSRRGDARA
jgi:hypothetical protein